MSERGRELGRLWILPLVLLAAGCGDDTTGVDSGGGGQDLSASTDGGSADLSNPNPNPDGSCVNGTFAGFPIASPTEQRFDCPCGCTIDSFEARMVTSLWNANVQSSTLAPTSTGLEVTPAPVDGGTAYAGLASVRPGNTFFLDGDFDLRIDYQLTGALPPDGHITLQVNDLSQTALGTYMVERLRQPGGENDYSTQLAGILPVNVPTSATSGTLELSRAGTTVRAVADGAEISRYTGAKGTRLAIVLAVGVQACAGAGCSFTVKWHNLRLTSGSLVDRQ